MKFSIIVPVYNVEKYIRECLESIINQQYDDYEMILIDDGSTDSSGSICDEYSGKYDNIVVIHKDNGGLSSARNAGLDVARGEWIWFIDSDDYIAAEAFTTLERVICKESADMISFNACKFADEGQNFSRLVFAAEYGGIDLRQEESRFKFIIDDILNYKVGWEAWLSIYRRSIIEAHMLRFIDTKTVFAEDLNFTLRYILHAERLYFICDILYYYRQVGNSLIHSYDETTVVSRLNNLAKSVYDEVSIGHFKLIKKQFHEIYIRIINHHAQYKLDSLSPDEIRNFIHSDAKSRKWFVKALKKADLSRLDFGRRKWL